MPKSEQKEVKCKKCDGKGYYQEKIQNRGTLEWREAIVPCDVAGCHNGKVNLKEYYNSF